MAENDTLFSWSDGSVNVVAVARAGPLHILVQLRHGPSAVLVRLPHAAAQELASALSAYIEETEPLAVVEQVLRLNTSVRLGETSTPRLAVWIVEALRAQGFLPMPEGESPST